MRARALLSVLAIASVAVFALPSEAAPRPKTLYFANEGGPGTGGCTPDYVLENAPAGNPCSNIQVGANGTGVLASDTFDSVKKATGFKVSSKAHLKGVVYLATYPILNIGASPAKTVPGPMGAKVTVSINGVELGTVTGSGQATAPNTDVAIPLDLAIPASLNKKVVKSVEVLVKYTSGVGVVGTDYSTANSSKLVIPTA